MAIEAGITLHLDAEQAAATCSNIGQTAGSNQRAVVERRRETRYAICEPVEVYLLNINNLRLNGTLRDISKNGMRIELDMPLKTGDRLEVLLQNKAIVFAEVRHCRRTGESYQVGTVIDDVYYAKPAATSRVSQSVESDTSCTNVTHSIRSWQRLTAESVKAGAGGSASRGVLDRIANSRPANAQTLGTHLNRNDVDNLLGLRLSDTRAVLLERHMASCDQCLDLVLGALEERESLSPAGAKAMPPREV